MNSPAVKGYALLFSGMATVGAYVALSKPLTAAIPVYLLATLRFAIAALIMLPWLGAGPGDRPLSREIRRTLFAQSFFGNFLFSICMLTGVSLTSAASSGVILSSLPAVVALLSWAWLRERLTTRVWIAVGLAVIAVAMLTLLKSGSPPNAVAPPSASFPGSGGAGSRNVTGGSAGELLVMACVFCEAVYVILGKRLSSALSAQRNSALLNLIGLLLMLPLGVWQALSFDFASVSAGIWSLLVFYALAASVVSTWLWLTGLRWVPASHSGVFTIALPISATAVGVVFLGETLTALHAVALVIAATGIYLIAGAPSTNEPTRHDQSSER